MNVASLLNIYRLFGRLRPPFGERPARATLILPITGPAKGLEDLLAALDAQTLRPRRLIAAVESERDPAFARVSALAASVGFPVEIVVAGEATEQGQKCRNQQAALARIDADDEAIVMLDADIRPQTWWLSGLVSPLAEGIADVVCGLRWHQAERHRLGAHLVTAIDRAAMLVPRSGGPRTSAIWGGSAALTPAAAQRIGLTDVLAHTVSDDLAIAEAAQRAGLEVLARRNLLVPCPTDLSLVAALRFGRRQYLILHVHRPWLWRLGVVTLSVRLTAWCTLLAMAVSGTLSVPLALALFALAATATLEQVLIGEIGRRVGVPDPPAVRLIQIALGPLQAVLDVFNLAAILSATWTRRLTWGHVVYDVASPNDVRVRRRLPFPSP